jgi:hypothetical protein
MSNKVLIEVDAKHESIGRRTLTLAEELEPLALTAPQGEVFDACQDAVLEKGRKLQAHVLAAAVTQPIAAAEKKGRRSAWAPGAAGRTIVGPKNAT